MSLHSFYMLYILLCVRWTTHDDGDGNHSSQFVVRNCNTFVIRMKLGQCHSFTGEFLLRTRFFAPLSDSAFLSLETNMYIHLENVMH